MKKALFICAVCAAVVATACCGGKQKVTAVVAGPDKVAAVVVEYPEALDAETVCPEAFVVEGREVVCAKLVEPTKVVVSLKKECCGEKPECCEPKPECCKEDAECCKEGAECCEPKPECCKEKPECCEKPEIPVPDVAVQQVVDIKTAEGKVVKAWKKAVKATEVVPACPPKHHECGEKPECGEHHCDKPADQQCDKCKAEE